MAKPNTLCLYLSPPSFFVQDMHVFHCLDLMQRLRLALCALEAQSVSMPVVRNHGLNL